MERLFAKRKSKKNAEVKMWTPMSVVSGSLLQWLRSMKYILRTRSGIATFISAGELLKDATDLKLRCVYP